MIDSVARIVATEQEEGEVAPDQRDGLDDRVGDPDAGPRDQVVGERVAEEPVDDAEDEQGHPDDPVELAGLAERTGEEDPGHVHARSTPRKMSAAQWCAWRIKSPDCTSKERPTVEE